MDDLQVKINCLECEAALFCTVSLKEYRLLYTSFLTEYNVKAVLLHAIQKKTDKTPKKELETALARMKDYESRR